MALEDADAQAQARRLMPKNHVFLEVGKVTLLKVFNRKPEVGAEYVGIRSGLTGGARRTWVMEIMEIMVGCGMDHKIVGLFVEK